MNFSQSLLAISLSLFSVNGQAGINNYQSILIGERAAGMGGAFTGLTGDPSACSFYNPATLARMEGTSLSASANLYNRYDVRYGDTNDFAASTTRVNQGNFKSIPASSGSVAAFGPFAMGLTIITPSYDFFSGSIQNTETTSTYMNVLDESLWIGGNIALNIDEVHSVGITMYYTSRFFQRSLSDEVRNGIHSRLTTEEKSFSTNSILTVLGYYARIDRNWSFGASFRPPSVQISGRGNYYSTTIDTENPAASVRQSRNEVPAESRTPARASLGIAYTLPSRFTLALDIIHYALESYDDLQNSDAADHVQQDAITNIAFGGEYYLKHWLRWRAGIFTNRSAHPDIGDTFSERAEHVNMIGVSTNFGVFTSDKVSFSVGGYYTGGEGYAVERIGARFLKVPKSERIFSMLIGSSYFF